MTQRRLLPILTLAAAAASSVLAARLIVTEVETRTLQEVEQVLVAEDARFSQAEVDGLRITLLGTAPDEATRFAVVAAVGRVVAPDRITDALDVAETTQIEPPEFSLELLHNSDGISMIGLVPGVLDPLDLAQKLGTETPVINMVETADFPMPPRLLGAIEYGLETARNVPRSKISVSAQSVHVSALSDSAAAKTALETRLRRTAPAGIAVTLDISAPRPALTPFLLRFAKTASGAGFDACSADNEAGRARILAAATAAGAPPTASCTLGLGTPSPDWAEAAVLAIRAISELGAGVVTLSDADITLVAADGTAPPLFERVTAELDADLPAVFSLTSTLANPEAPRPGIFEPELLRFTGTLSPEGLVQLRGHVTDDTRKEVTTALAQAMFGAPNVYSATGVPETVPEGWSIRVLAGIEALGRLHNGSVTVTSEYIRLAGRMGKTEGPAEVASLLAQRLPSEADLRLEVVYDPILDPSTALPTDAECFARLDEVQADGKITFDPGSAQIAAEARTIIGKVAEVLADCSHVEIEIAGHTDDQGREIMNLNLSQARADAVLGALADRRLLTSNLLAKGYGEALPIADNDTAEGREANRRISFTPPTPPVRTPETAETPASEGEEP